MCLLWHMINANTTVLRTSSVLVKPDLPERCAFNALCQGTNRFTQRRRRLSVLRLHRHQVLARKLRSSSLPNLGKRLHSSPMPSTSPRCVTRSPSQCNNGRRHDHRCRRTHRRLRGQWTSSYRGSPRLPSAFRRTPLYNNSSSKDITWHLLARRVRGKFVFVWLKLKSSFSAVPVLQCSHDGYGYESDAYVLSLSSSATRFAGSTAGSYVRLCSPMVHRLT